MFTFGVESLSNHDEIDNHEVTGHILNDFKDEEIDSTEISSYVEDENKPLSTRDKPFHRMGSSRSMTHGIKSVLPVIFEEVLEKNKIENIVSYQQLNIKELIGIDIELIPDYLDHSNDCFHEFIYSVRPDLLKKEVELLRHVAMIMHKTLLLEKLKCLWTVYQTCGTDQMVYSKQFQQSLLQNWLENIRTRVKYIDESLLHIQTVDSHNTHYELFVNLCLQKLTDQFNEYHHQLQFGTTYFLDYTFSLEQTIQTFVLQKFQSQSLHYDCQIEMIKYQYIDALLNQQYIDERPTDKQMNLYQYLSQLKYEEARTKYNLNYLQVIRSNTSVLKHMRNLFRGCWPIFDHASDRMEFDDLSMSVSKANEEMRQYRQRFNFELNQICQREKSLPEEQRFTPRMVSLLEQYFANIDTKLACINRYRIQLFKVSNQ